MKQGVNLLIISALGASVTAVEAQSPLKEAKPNVIVILADDLGYGDIGCNGAVGVRTPNVDRLAAAGVRLTNAHAVAATSTPSRYSILTGQYAWRRNDTGVAQGDAAMLVRATQKSLASMMQRAGYRTAAVGKWHLGLGDRAGQQDWNGRISPALDAIGFDYSYIMAATGDRVPCVYIEQGRVVGLDPHDPISVSYTTPFEGQMTGANNPDLLTLHPSHGHDQALINGVSRIGYMKGGRNALWVDQNIADSITTKALQFIERNANDPFFLYMCTNDIHVPRVPHPRFVGASGMGARGDAILEFDWTVGQVLDKLEELGIAQNTLIILTSDNGPVVDDGYADRAVELLGFHRPSGDMRGGKYSIFEAGTRVPAIVRWPSRVKGGVVSDALVSQIDIFASLAEVADVALQKDEAPDSRPQLQAWTGVDAKGREWIVEQAGTLSITVDGWKYIQPSHGASYDKNTAIELGNAPTDQLYDLANDKGERKNLASRYPEKIAKMRSMLEKIKINDETL